jgi:PhnB protein
MPARPIPEGYEDPIPFTTRRARSSFISGRSVRERVRMNTPDGEAAHAELEIGGRIVMLADRLPIYPWRPPNELGGTSVGMGMYVEDVDAVVQQAVDAGARVTLPVEDRFYGDRYGRVADPFEHEWQIATHTEDLTAEEIAARGREAMAGPS